MSDNREIPSVSQKVFGQLPDGRDAQLFTLTNSQGMIVKITDFGGIITELHVPDKHGQLADVALGFDHLAPYCDVSPYFGALIGRFGNRIADGRFVLDDVSYQLPCNDGDNHLHGGSAGFHRVKWDAIPFVRNDARGEIAAVGLTLSYLSVDGEQGYPGNLQVTVTYTLTNANELQVLYQAETDQATPINLTQHTYFNLAGISDSVSDILGHELMINADAYTPVNSALIPTGSLLSVADTAFDFRTPKLIGARIQDEDQQLGYGSGYDHNYVLNKSRSKEFSQELSLAARVHEPVSGRVLELWTQEPGIQFYSGNFLDGSLSGKTANYGHRSGFCLEPQHYPDSPNQTAFPNTILRPGEEYESLSVYRFSVQD
ncbi:aldose 1-epimerase [Undibacterium sp. GrIS 1.2]|uniref:aldose epimerase family protein n=1 Tax=Undibacterium sp. GrIS 1.2 TaxID=3143933 RepID=UPI0033940AB6